MYFKNFCNFSNKSDFMRSAVWTIVYTAFCVAVYFSA